LKTILISEGDPTSINYELLEKSQPLLKRLAKSHRILLIRGNHNIQTKIFIEAEVPPKKPGLYQVTAKGEKQKLKLGIPSLASGSLAFQSFQRAMEMQKPMKADLLTLPLSKEWVKKAGYSDFRGHTESLADFFASETFMMMTGPHWKVVPLTTHVPLKDVVSELKRFPWDSFVLALESSKFSKKQKIGFLGLNPHAGEGGKIGVEEIEIINPAIDLLSSRGWRVEGPLSADSAFLPGSPKLDLILACYHDQGLIPFKLLEGKKGINFTLGLDFRRVSPDHGTAFGIAGKGIADPTSVLSCLAVLTEGNR